MKIFLLITLAVLFLAAPAFSAQRMETIGSMLPKENRLTNDTGKAVFSGNVKTKKFHNPGCKFYDCRDCTARFKSRKEALARGYDECKKCPGRDGE